jgi:hypothetical protein
MWHDGSRARSGRHTSPRDQGQPPGRRYMVVWPCRAGIYSSCGDTYRRGRRARVSIAAHKDGRRSRHGASVRGVDPPPACNWGAPFDDGRGRRRRGRGRRCRGGGRRRQTQVGAHILYGFRVCEIHGELFLTTRSRNGSWSRSSCLLLLSWRQAVDGRHKTSGSASQSRKKNGLGEGAFGKQVWVWPVRLAGRRAGGRALGTGHWALGTGQGRRWRWRWRRTFPSLWPVEP